MNIDLNGMDKDQLAQLVTGLLAKLEEAQKPKTLTFKVSEKGALSVYGLGRFPVTLYIGTWEKLFANREAIAAFAKTNANLLSRKD